MGVLAFGSQGSQPSGGRVKGHELAIGFLYYKGFFLPLKYILLVYIAHMVNTGGDADFLQRLPKMANQQKG